ncbi:MAG: chorismate mutase, partial [Anaerolineaceae bacterium]|nr:chorismate mutase [Anaerolineaceae bacterium]
MALNEIRERMNSLNDEMLELFMERMKLSEAIAAY